MIEKGFSTPAHNVREAPIYIVIHDTDILQAEHAEQLDLVNAAHMRRGYDLSSEGFYVCYHYFIGTNGVVVRTRPETDRTMCTRNDAINMKAIQIVLAGSFDTDKPNEYQTQTLKRLVNELQERYKIQKKNIIGHREASPTSCPGKNIMDIISHYRSLQ